MLRGMYRPLGFEYAEQLQRQLYTYVTHYSGVYGNKIFWTPIDLDSVISFCPLLSLVIDLIGAKPRFASINQIEDVSVDRYNRSFEKIHIDVDRAVVLLTPVLNCETTETVFYDVPKTELVSKKLPTSIGAPYFTTKHTSYPILGKFKLTEPTIFNTGIPHGILVPDESPLPRISMNIRFKSKVDSLLYP